MKENKNLTEFMLSLVHTLEGEHRFGSAHVYRSTLHTFIAYWNKCKGKQAPMGVRDVFTVNVLRGFEEYLQGKSLKMNTISTYMRMLRAVYHRLLKDGEVDYIAGLFDCVYTGTCADVKRALSPVDMAKVLSFPLRDSCHAAAVSSGSSPLPDNALRKVQCWFSLLFLLRGIPFSDLARLRKCDYRDGVIRYCRRKTGRRLTVTVPEEAKPLLRACSDPDPGSPYLLSILGSGHTGEAGSREEYDRYQRVLRDFNRWLRLLPSAIGINKNGNNTAIALLPSVNHSKGNAFIKIKSGNNTLYYTPETQISLVAGKLYTFNIKIIDNAKLVIVSSTIDNFQPNQDSLPVVIKVPPKTGAFYLKNHTFKDIDAPTRQDYQDVIGVVVRSKYKSITILQLGNVNAGVMTFSTYYYKSYCLKDDGFDLATPDNLNELHQYMKTDVGMNKTLYAAYNITGIRNNLSEALLNFGNARFLPGDNNKETFFWTKGSKPGNDVWGAYLDGATSEIKTCVLANSHTSTLPGIYFKVINY